MVNLLLLIFYKLYDKTALLYNKLLWNDFIWMLAELMCLKLQHPFCILAFGPFHPFWIIFDTRTDFYTHHITSHHIISQCIALDSIKSKRIVVDFVDKLSIYMILNGEQILCSIFQCPNVWKCAIEFVSWTRISIFGIRMHWNSISRTILLTWRKSSQIYVREWSGPSQEQIDWMNSLVLRTKVNQNWQKFECDFQYFLVFLICIAVVVLVS